ncbi:glycosyltransferase [bacterium]|nr:glycosyltransferase [bacterium]
MEKLLYIGHAYHNKTKSTEFLQDILAQRYEVEKFDFDPCKDSFDVFKKLKGKKYDVVVILQIMPSVKELRKYISFNRMAFFPMYDDKGNLDGELWLEYADCNIINFSKTLHEECLKRGFSSNYIQYFPKPVKIENFGDEKSVFLWQRTNIINPFVVEKLLDTENINHFYLHNAPDPGHSLSEPPESLKNKTKITTWFATKNDLLNHIQKSAVYIAPRLFEGIGMSFLEAMALGRCVIAPNNPTMNEYIENNKTGYLYDINNPEQIEIKNIRKIQEDSAKYIENGYKNWEENKLSVLEWINKKPEPQKFKIWLNYNKKNFLKNMFSISNDYMTGEKRKVIRILGTKTSFKVKNKKEKVC